VSCVSACSDLGVRTCETPDSAAISKQEAEVLSKTSTHNDRSWHVITVSGVKESGWRRLQGRMWTRWFGVKCISCDTSVLV
jgi:hypothetical protein